MRASTAVVPRPDTYALLPSTDVLVRAYGHRAQDPDSHSRGPLGEQEATRGTAAPPHPYHQLHAIVLGNAWYSRYSPSHYSPTREGY